MLAHTRNSPARDERGAAAVEFALVLPLLVMILLGTITSGVSYANAIGVTNAVREGARFGATVDANNASWATNVVSRVRDTQFDDPGAETKVCVQLVTGAGAVKKSQCEGSGPALSYPAVPSSVPAGACVVMVVASRPFSINAVFHQWHEHLIKSSVTRFERETCS